jgi:hypothetical protein
MKIKVKGTKRKIKIDLPQFHLIIDKDLKGVEVVTLDVVETPLYTHAATKRMMKRFENKYSKL